MVTITKPQTLGVSENNRNLAHYFYHILWAKQIIEPARIHELGKET